MKYIHGTIEVIRLEGKMVSRNVKKGAEKYFAPEQMDEVLRILGTYPGYPSFPQEFICMEVLRRSKGDLDKLKIDIEDTIKDPLNLFPNSPKHAANVKEFAKRYFAPEQMDEALRILETYPGYPLFSRENIYSLVIPDSNGDLDKLRIGIERAIEDPRDLFYIPPEEVAKRTDEATRKYAATFFPPEQLDDVLQLLHGYNDKAGDKYMVKTAIIKLSKGNLETLKYYLAMAKKDYRNVLDLSAKLND